MAVDVVGVVFETEEGESSRVNCPSLSGAAFGWAGAVRGFGPEGWVVDGVVVDRLPHTSHLATV